MHPDSPTVVPPFYVLDHTWILLFSFSRLKSEKKIKLENLSTVYVTEGVRIAYNDKIAMHPDIYSVPLFQEWGQSAWPRNIQRET